MKFIIMHTFIQPPPLFCNPHLEGEAPLTNGKFAELPPNIEEIRHHYLILVVINKNRKIPETAE